MLARGWLICAAVWCFASCGAHAGELICEPSQFGIDIAKQVCSTCHVVSKDQKTEPMLKERTPSFAEIAGKPSTTAQSLRAFIEATHWDRTFPMSMPRLNLSPEQVDAVTCYILSLRPPPARTGGPDPQVERGRQLARIECSQCHVVDRDLSPSPEIAAPAFEAVANQHGISGKSLRHFISTTHWDGQTIPITMPAQGLTEQETDALVAYIMSLRKSQGGQ